eukprot:791699-Pelagomonas_calceolata.AAC.2
MEEVVEAGLLPASEYAAKVSMHTLSASSRSEVQGWVLSIVKRVEKDEWGGLPRVLQALAAL